MRFQHFTPWLTEKDVGQLKSTPDVSKHWIRVMRDEPSYLATRTVEQIFEDVRQQEYPLLPSRKNCIFLFDFGLDPDEYAKSMSLIEVRRELNLAEVVCEPAKSIIARVDKSLLTARFTEGELKATNDEIVHDANRYWTGTTRSDYNTEILLFGEFKYSRIIRRADDPLDERLERFQRERLLAGRERIADRLRTIS